MTVFIAVLALHVLVIGGFSVWHLLYPANADSDLAIDKTHKSKITGDSTIGDVTASDSAPADKTASSAPATDNSGNGDTTAAADAPAPADASTTASTTPAPATPAAPAVANDSSPSANSVITVPSSPVMPATPTVADDASVDTAAPTVTAQTPSGPVHHGPVVNPPDNLAPPADTTASTAPSATVDAETPAVVVNGTPYIVKRGDSLARIAHRHHVALAKLRSANSLASDSLHLGQKLVIPGRTAKAAPDASEALASTPSTASTASAPSTASTYPVAQPVQESDGVTTPAPRSTLASALPRHTHKVASTSTHHLYTVVRGDTLTKIAKRYHTTTSALMAVNSLPNAGRLSIGQKLHIPSHQSHEASTAQQGTMPESEPHSTAKGQLANYVQ
jgi:LysM repeat protein